VAEEQVMLEDSLDAAVDEHIADVPAAEVETVQGLVPEQAEESSAEDSAQESAAAEPVATEAALEEPPAAQAAPEEPPSAEAAVETPAAEQLTAEEADEKQATDDVPVVDAEQLADAESSGPQPVAEQAQD
jgi:hypothetical protein